uniref:Large ribosomal subunit protein mL38 n=1 Tax=Iconisemion striatum TaxID=60296 RepID=A0A1A7XLK1_9TELE
MALRRVGFSALRIGPDLWVNNGRTFVTTAFLSRRLPPLGSMPNEEIDVANLDSLEKYRSYTRYFRQAQEAKNKPVWWKTYRSHVEKADPEHGAERVDIGLPYHQTCRTKEARVRRQVMKDNKRNAELEQASRLRTLRISLDGVEETWRETSAPFQLKRLADHYGVFRDLFPMSYFLPQVTLHISYSQENRGQVHYGNQLTATEAASVPQVSFAAEEGSLWTLLLTCPDEHLVDNEAEYIHWLVGNIPGGAVQDGEELCHYLPPFPSRGTGFHRYIYILFRQDRRISFQEDIRPSPCHSLVERTFKTIDFYRKHQNSMTPAGLAFFQSQWDQSVTSTFHHTLSESLIVQTKTHDCERLKRFLGTMKTNTHRGDEDHNEGVTNHLFLQSNNWVHKFLSLIQTCAPPQRWPADINKHRPPCFHSHSSL